MHQNHPNTSPIDNLQINNYSQIRDPRSPIDLMCPVYSSATIGLSRPRRIHANCDIMK
jgi:hypothetical protein